MALKGLGAQISSRHTLRIGVVLLLVGAAGALLPPIDGLPLAAYVSVACLLVGGIACVPGGVGLALSGTAESRRPLALLAIERARQQRDTATVAVAGVVASLALSVALTTMVASFREAVTHWLDVVLPADLYARAAVGPGGGDVATLPPALPARALAITGVQRVEAQRVVAISFDPARPAAALIARPLDDPAGRLPLTGDLVAARAGLPSVFVSEAVVAL